MKLWLISQKANSDYDTYDSAVVAAETEQLARETSPSGEWGSPYTAWASSPDQVEVKLIGDAVAGTEAGVICASFNAG